MKKLDPSGCSICHNELSTLSIDLYSDGTVWQWYTEEGWPVEKATPYGPAHVSSDAAQKWALSMGYSTPGMWWQYADKVREAGARFRRELGKRANPHDPTEPWPPRPEDPGWLTANLADPEFRRLYEQGLAAERRRAKRKKS